MTGIYTLSTEIELCCSHSLNEYDGDCSRVHGHNWLVRVYYEFKKVDENGLTVDYLRLRADMEKILLPRFDHRHLNEVPPFDRINPTSENIAAEIFRLLREETAYEGGRLVEVELWETRMDMVRYRED
ncbi:MAG: 6-carboxytetrahydropterin synthase [Candidatus Krumholzibacteria bacterium]|nr:6-carboxytetrahydropterin synthase [Candidatus Krumholzibacteria bacterium]